MATTTQTVELVLPEPPSANRYYRNFRGRMVRSADARAYVAQVATLTRGCQWYATGAVRVTLHWYRSRKAGDLDNRAKVALDALNGLLWTDDRQITELHLYRHDAPKRGRLHLIAEVI